MYRYTQALDFSVEQVGIVCELDVPALSWAGMQFDMDGGSAWGGLVIQCQGKMAMQAGLGVYYEVDATKRLSAASGVVPAIDINGYARICIYVSTKSGTSGARGNFYLYAEGDG